MVKSRVAPHKCLLCVVPNHIEDMIYSNRAVSTIGLIKNFYILSNSIQLCN